MSKSPSEIACYDVSKIYNDHLDKCIEEMNKLTQENYKLKREIEAFKESHPLSKNETIALELTKAWAMQNGNAVSMSTVLEKYDLALTYFNGKDKEKENNE